MMFLTSGRSAGSGFGCYFPEGQWLSSGLEVYDCYSTW